MVKKEMMKKWVKRIGLGGLVLILSLSVIASVLLLTPVGTSLVKWGGNKFVDGLNIEQAQGALLIDLHLEKVTYQAQGIDLKAQDLSLDITPSALLHKELKVDLIALKGVQFSYQAMSQPPQAEEEKSTSSGQINLPLSINLNKIVVDDAHLDMLGNKIDWDHFSTALTLSGKTLTLKPTLWQKLNVYLAKTQEAKTAPQSTPSHQQRIVLPKVELPLDINVQGVKLEQFALYQAERKKAQVIINEFFFNLVAQKSKMKIEKLHLNMPEVVLDAKLALTLDKNYPLDVNLNADIKMPLAKNHKVVLDASGDLADLKAHLDLSGPQQAKIIAQLNALDPNLPFDVHLTSTKLGYPIQTLSDYRIENTDFSAKGSLKKFVLNLKAKTMGTQAPHSDVFVTGNGGLGQQGDWHILLSQLKVIGDYKALPLDINGKLQAASKNGELGLHTSGINIAHGQNKVIFKGDIDKRYHLDLLLDIPHLAKSLPNTEGSIGGDIKVTGLLATPKLNLDINAQNLVLQKTNKLKSLSIQGDVTTSMKKGMARPFISTDIKIDAQNVQAGTAKITQLNLDVTGNETQHRVQMQMTGEPAGVNLDLSGSFDPKKGWFGQLNTADIMTSEGNWRLQRTTDIHYLLANKAFRLAPNCWGLKQSQICVAQALDFVPNQPGQTQLLVKDLDFSLLKTFLPPKTQLSGSANAKIDAQWDAHLEPKIDALIQLPKGKVTQNLSQPMIFGWDKINIKAKLYDHQLSSNYLIDVTNNGDIFGDLTIDNIGSVHPKMQGNMKITPFDLAFISPALGEGVAIKGKVSSDIKISGSVDKPALNGHLNISQYQMFGDKTPTEIKSGNIALIFDQYTGKLTGKITTGDGVLNLKGDANWQDLATWRTNLNIKGHELKVTPQTGMSIMLSPDLTLSATPTDAEVKGVIRLPWARIRIKEVPKGAVSIDSDQRYLDKKLQVVHKDESMPLNVKTDIKVIIDKDVKLQAFGLSSFMQGELHITQVNQSPYIEGDINLLNGTYIAMGQNLQITKGRIFFTGPASQPYIDVTAIRNPDTIEDDVTAGINVTGPADDTKVSFFSDPSMEESEVLSYILRGRGISSDGGSSSIASTLIGLGLSQGSGIVGSIGDSLGVSDLSLDSEGSGDDTAVSVSGYITPDLQLKYGVGLFSSVGEFTLKYRLVQKLYLQAVSGLDSSVDLLYQFSFD